MGEEDGRQESELQAFTAKDAEGAKNQGKGYRAQSGNTAGNAVGVK